MVLATTINKTNAFKAGFAENIFKGSCMRGYFYGSHMKHGQSLLSSTITFYDKIFGT